MSMKPRLTLATVSFFIPYIALAQHAGDVSAKFGLMGHWAQNCSAVSGPGNWHINYTVNPSGEVIRRMVRTEEVRLSTIKKAQALDSNNLSIHEVYGQGWGEYAGVTKDYILQFNEDHTQYQSIVSVYDKMESFIKDGKMTETGKKSPLVEKCSP